VVKKNIPQKAGTIGSKANVQRGAGDRRKATGLRAAEERQREASLQKAAADLLATKAVELVIGYGLSSGGDVVPVFLGRPEEAEALGWNQHCTYNLVRYLTDPDAVGNAGARIKGGGEDSPSAPGRVAIVVKGCDLKSLVVLQSENQVQRERLTVIGMPCPGVVDQAGRLLAKCEECPPDVYNPRQELCDLVIGEPVKRSGGGSTARSDARSAEKDDPHGRPTPYGQPSPYGDVRQIDALDPTERRAFWDGYLARCLRCYACRNVCPLCYCKECVFDQHDPRWVSPAAAVASNRSFHLIRAYHLAGRCVDCGECERACPVGIPLRRINRKAAKVVEESFHFRAGIDPQARSPLVAFADEDPQEFIE
jgi:formate dehydrogenase subunit beta